MKQIKRDKTLLVSFVEMNNHAVSNLEAKKILKCTKKHSSHIGYNVLEMQTPIWEAKHMTSPNSGIRRRNIPVPMQNILIYAWILYFLFKEFSNSASSSKSECVHELVASYFKGTVLPGKYTCFIEFPHCMVLHSHRLLLFIFTIHMGYESVFKK